MQIVSNTGGVVSTNAYLVADEAAGEAVLFDAPDHTAGPLLDEADRRGWRVKGLWLTHGHFDHIADHAVVRQRFPDAELRLHPADAALLREPGPQLRLMGVPLDIPPGEPTHGLADGDVLAIGSLRVEVVATPGHAPGHVCFHLPAEKVLIGGDLILMHAIGRTDLPGGDLPTLMASLRRVMALPDDTALLPGHGPPTTLAEERRVNPYVAEALRG